MRLKLDKLSYVMRPIALVLGSAIVITCALKGIDIGVTVGTAMIFWAIPYLKEIVLKDVIQKAIVDIEAGRRTTAEKRLRRASQAPAILREEEESVVMAPVRNPLGETDKPLFPKPGREKDNTPTEKPPK